MMRRTAVIVFLLFLTVALVVAQDVRRRPMYPAAGGSDVTYAGNVGTGTNRGFTSITFSVTVTSGTNDWLVVGCGAYVPAVFSVPTGVTVNGNAATELGTLRTEGNTQFNSLWGFVNPTSGTYNIVVTLDNSANALSCGAAVFYNVNQTTPCTNFASGTGDTLNVTSATGNMVVNGFVTWPENTYTPGAGQTQVYQLNDNPGDPGTITSMSYKAGSTTTALSWTPSSTSPSMTGCNVNKA